MLFPLRSVLGWRANHKSLQINPVKFAGFSSSRLLHGMAVRVAAPALGAVVAWSAVVAFARWQALPVVVQKAGSQVAPNALCDDSRARRVFSLMIPINTDQAMELLILTDSHNVAVLQWPASKTWAPPLRLDDSFRRAASSKHHKSCMLGTCMSVVRFVSRVLSVDPLSC